MLYFAELPGLLLSAIIVDRVGRKLSLIIMLTLAFIFLLPLAFHQSTILTTGLLFGARMCTMGTITVTCIYAPEVSPTIPSKRVCFGLNQCLNFLMNLTCLNIGK